MREPASVRRQAPRNVASILDLARELGIRDAQVCEQQVLKCEFIERSLIEWNSTKWCRLAVSHEYRGHELSIFHIVTDPHRLSIASACNDLFGCERSGGSRKRLPGVLAWAPEDEPEAGHWTEPLGPLPFFWAGVCLSGLQWGATRCSNCRSLVIGLHVPFPSVLSIVHDCLLLPGISAREVLRPMGPPRLQ